jgi:hypothetical protein
MALHRDIHWIGRQWAVTGYGMQAINQKHGGQFDIDVAHLWDEGLTESLREQKWFNPDDFAKGLAIAKKRFPEPPRPPEPEPAPPRLPTPPPAAPLLQASGVITPPAEAVPVPPPLPAPTVLQASGVIAPPPKAAEIAKPESVPKAEEAAQPSHPAKQEDLLAKWFDAYGLSGEPSSAPRPEPEPPRKAIPRAPELPATPSIEPPKPLPPTHQMRIPGRARFVRPWRFPPRSS